MTDGLIAPHGGKLILNSAGEAEGAEGQSKTDIGKSENAASFKPPFPTYTAEFSQRTRTRAEVIVSVS